MHLSVKTWMLKIFVLINFWKHSCIFSLINFCLGYCNLAYPNFTDGNVKYIREGFEKRVIFLYILTHLKFIHWQLYDEDVGKSGSRLCGCNAGPELKCTWLEEIEKKPCNTDSAFYRYLYYSIYNELINCLDVYMVQIYLW